MTEESLSPLVETSRLLLRPPVLADAPALAHLADNPRVAENLARLPHPYTLADAEDFLAHAAPEGSARFAILVRGAGSPTFIGVISLQGEGRDAELGYWLGEPHWGRGYATEAAHAVVDYGFLRLGLTRIHVRCRVTNAGSRRVVEKCGFQYVGQGLGTSSYFRAAMPVDRFALDRATWASLRRWEPARWGGVPLAMPAGCARDDLPGALAAAHC